MLAHVLITLLLNHRLISIWTPIHEYTYVFLCTSLQVNVHVHKELNGGGAIAFNVRIFLVALCVNQVQLKVFLFHLDLQILIVYALPSHVKFKFMPYKWIGLNFFSLVCDQTRTNYTYCPLECMCCYYRNTSLFSRFFRVGKSICFNSNAQNSDASKSPGVNYQLPLELILNDFECWYSEFNSRFSVLFFFNIP